MVEAAAMFTKAMELAPGDFEVAFTAAGYLRYILVKKGNRHDAVCILQLYFLYYFYFDLPL